MRSIVAAALICLTHLVFADVSRIEISSRETLSGNGQNFTYERITGLVHLTLDPTDPGNAAIADLEHAPTNTRGLVEYAADFRLLVPSAEIANGTLVYHVNNRGRSTTHPESSLDHPLAKQGFTYLVTGWIAELAPGEGLLRLHTPSVGSDSDPITGDVRYEVSVGRADNNVNIAGGGHLAYRPTQKGLDEASLTRRLYQDDPRIALPRSQFDLAVNEVAGSDQVEVILSVDGGMQPGYLYELVYEATDSALSGAGMAAVRDLVSAIRYGDGDSELLSDLALPPVDHAMTWGVSQSGRLLRQYLYDGFNADLSGRIVFDGVIPVIAGGGYGMFNMRFAMPTRTNGHHSNHLYPNDLFPFTYGESTDPFTGKTDGVLLKARAAGVEPRLMHIQTSNEYWLRAGSLPHTSPDGSADAAIPDNVRFYTIGGSQHGSGNGIPGETTTTQLIRNPSMWTPISDSLIVAMHKWVVDGTEPPASRYPRIAEGTLVTSHVDGRINRDAWNRINGINHPSSMYRPSHNDYGTSWESDRVVSDHPTGSDHFYTPLVPAVDTDNNDLSASTILPPLAQVPLATFVSWNLRAPATGAERSLARLAGGYIPFARNTFDALANRDQRNSIEGLYGSFDDYLTRYEAATDQLIEEGFLLPDFKADYMAIAEQNAGMFP